MSDRELLSSFNLTHILPPSINHGAFPSQEFVTSLADCDEPETLNKGFWRAKFPFFA
jgi:hypothetical protein